MSYSNYNLPFIESTTDVIDVKPYMKKQGANLMLEIPNEVNGQLEKNTQQFKIKMSEPIYTIDFAPYKEKKQHLSGKEESNNIDSNNPQMGKNLTEALPKPNVFQTIETFIDENNISDNEPPKNQNGYRTNGDELNNYQSIETVEYKNGHQNFDLDNDFHHILLIGYFLQLWQVHVLFFHFFFGLKVKANMNHC